MQQFFFIRTDGQYVRVDYKDIVYVEAVKNYISIVTASRKILALVSLKQLEMLLPLNSFRRVHRSYIVSYDFIKAFDREYVYMLNGLSIPISGPYRKEFREQSTILLSETRCRSALALRKEMLVHD